MTVSTTTTRASYSGNDVTVEFAIPFKFLQNSDITATLVDAAGAETAWVLDTDYTLAGVGDDAGGTLTATTAPATGETLVIERVLTLTQTLDLLANDSADAEAQEEALDRIVMMVQQLNTGQGDGIAFPSTYTGGASPEFPVPGADRFIKWNAAGTALEAVALAALGAITLPLGVAAGGTGATTAAGARTNLGLGGLATLSSVDTTELADDAVTLAKIAAGTDGELITWDASGDPATVGAGTSGQVLTSNGAGAAPTFQDAGGGGAWALISTATASASSSLDFTGFNSALYSSYVLIIENLVPATDNVQMFLRTSTDGGSTFDNGASDYTWAIVGRMGTGNSIDADSGTGDTEIELSRSFGISNVAGEGGFSAVVDIFKPDDAVFTKIGWRATWQYYNNAVSTAFIDGGGQRLSAADVDAVRLLTSSGNITSGTVRFLGQVK